MKEIAGASTFESPSLRSKLVIYERRGGREWYSVGYWRVEYPKRLDVSGSLKRSLFKCRHGISPERIKLLFLQERRLRCELPSIDRAAGKTLGSQRDLSECLIGERDGVSLRQPRKRIR